MVLFTFNYWQRWNWASCNIQQTFSKWTGFYHHRIWYSFANPNFILAMRYIIFLYRNTSLEKYCIISIHKRQFQEFQVSNFKIQESQVQQYFSLSSFWQWCLQFRFYSFSVVYHLHFKFFQYFFPLKGNW